MSKPERLQRGLDGKTFAMPLPGGQENPHRQKNGSGDYLINGHDGSLGIVKAHSPPQNQTPQIDLPFATPAQLKSRWACSGMKIRRWMRSGKLPYHVFGRHVRIAWADILRIEAAARVEIAESRPA